ncbi:ATP-binding protein [Chitinophaga sp.]|uniref:ATP-binding protein n=1 Tax=Chitinophaga sp. TaxID=1869181 RepID=UPI0031E28EC0
MRSFLVYILFLLASSQLYAQQQVPFNEQRYLDSLQSILRLKTADSLKADASFLLVEYWKIKDSVKCRQYLEMGKQYAKTNSYYSALGHFYEGQYYFNSDHAKAAKAFERAINALTPFHTQKAYAKLAAAWYNFGLMNREEKGYDYLAKITLEKAIPNAEKGGGSKLVAQYYTQLSTILMNNYQFTKAAQYSQNAIELLERESPGSTDLLFAYLSAVSINCYDHHPEKAREFLLKAHELLAPFPQSLNNALYYYNETLYYLTTEEYTHALVSIDKGMTLAEKYNQKQLYQQLRFRRYEIYGAMKDYVKARQLLMDIVREGTLTANSNDRAAIYLEIAQTSEKLKDYREAYNWLNRHRALTDSIYNQQTNLKVTELETRYRTSQQQQQIAALKARNEQALLMANNERMFSWFMGVTCLFLLVILGFVLLNARNRRKLNEQKEINYRQQLSDMERKQELKVTRAMLDGEEHERERVARDLHDGLGGMLAGVKIGLSGWSDTRPIAAGDKELNRIIAQLDSSVGELRRIARNMIPETLMKFGLETALKDLCEFHMRENLHINYEAFDIRRDIALNVQLNIYRIVQELLSNAIKHAQARNIMLQCSQNGSMFFITFEDDGIGFDPAILNNKKGMGLDNLQNRIAYLKGKLEILSDINEGTTINVELDTTVHE